MDVSYSRDWKRLKVSEGRLPCLPDENFRISSFYKGEKLQNIQYTYIILLPQITHWWPFKGRGWQL